MPQRAERLAIRWLLRCTVLALIAIAVWSTLYDDYSRGHAAGATGAEDGTTTASPPSSIDEPRGNALVVASLKKDDTSWLKEGIENLEGWERNIYIVDGEGDLTVPKNKGREGMVYLTFIIDNYSNLPNVTAFLHSQRYQWHNDDPIYDGLPTLQNLRVSHVHDEGYANLRCCWTLGCPAEMQPNKAHPANKDKASEIHYRDAFRELFPGRDVPDAVGVGCCAQFAATKATIRSRPKADYERYRTWLLETPLPDDVSGRILEYAWHMILGKPAVHCPPAAECYCRTFGYCDLTCGEGTCQGRYVLPPYSTLPVGWPEKGWDD